MSEESCTPNHAALGLYKQLRDEWEEAARAAVAFARTLEPVLRDYGANNTADRLQAVLGEVERLDFDMDELICDHGPEIIEEFVCEIQSCCWSPEPE